MQKPTLNNSNKNRTAAAAGKPATHKHKQVLYIKGKKITGKLLNIFNYQYKDSDLEQFVF